MLVSRIAGVAAFAALLFGQSVLAAPVPNIDDLSDVALALPELELEGVDSSDFALVRRAKPKVAAKPKAAAAPKAKAPAAPKAKAPAAAKKPAPAAKVKPVAAKPAAKATGEEYFFRFEDTSVLTAGSNILPLAPRAGTKDFDDQAYKFISMNAATVTRAKISGRVPAVYVLPAGTRAAMTAAAKDFEVERDAKRAANFVVKDNEPGDVGINGVANSGQALTDFRAKVIRTVVKQTSSKAGGKATFTTITKGKTSKTASQADQAALAKFS